jgi:hypothetical protein
VVRPLVAILAVAAAMAVGDRRQLLAQQPVVRGEVVAVECALTKGDAGRGEAHAAHAMAVAKRGDQMAILADDGLYLVVGDYTANANAKLLDFVARRVEAKGTIGEQDGAKTIRVAAMMVLRESGPE